MHTVLLLLAAVLPGDNPVRVEGDIAPPGPLDLRGRWRGLFTSGPLRSSRRSPWSICTSNGGRQPAKAHHPLSPMRLTSC
jgi:hypothetical protein